MIHIDISEGAINEAEKKEALFVAQDIQQTIKNQVVILSFGWRLLIAILPP